MTRPPRTARDTTSATHQRGSKVSVSQMQQPVPRLPNEIDESADSQAHPPRKIIVQAVLDLAHGLSDTDRGPPSAKAYSKQKS